MPLGIAFSFAPTVSNVFELCVRVAAGTATSHYGWGCGHQWCGCFKGSWWQNTTLFNLKALASGTHSAPFEPQKTLFKWKKAKRKGKKNWTELVFWLQGHFSDFAATNTGWRLLKKLNGPFNAFTQSQRIRQEVTQIMSCESLSRELMVISRASTTSSYTFFF